MRQLPRKRPAGRSPETVPTRTRDRAKNQGQYRNNEWPRFGGVFFVESQPWPTLCEDHWGQPTIVENVPKNVPVRAAVCEEPNAASRPHSLQLGNRSGIGGMEAIAAFGRRQLEQSSCLVAVISDEVPLSDIEIRFAVGAQRIDSLKHGLGRTAAEI